MGGGTLRFRSCHRVPFECSPGHLIALRFHCQRETESSNVAGLDRVWFAVWLLNRWSIETLMPIEYDIIENKKLVLTIGSGEVTGDDVLGHLDQLAVDQRYAAPMKKLVDYRFIEGINISPEEAREIARKKLSLRAVFHEETCAFVSPGDVTYGISRVHQALVDSSDVNTGVFRRIEEAWQWLGFSSDPALD